MKGRTGLLTVGLTFLANPDSRLVVKVPTHVPTKTTLYTLRITNNPHLAISDGNGQHRPHLDHPELYPSCNSLCIQHPRPRPQVKAGIPSAAGEPKQTVLGWHEGNGPAVHVCRQVNRRQAMPAQVILEDFIASIR